MTDIWNEKNASALIKAYLDDYCDALRDQKQSLKKWEIELGIHRQELGLDWDTPVESLAAAFGEDKNYVSMTQEDKGTNNLEKAKEIVKEYYSHACCGIYNSRNLVGDTMSRIYEGRGLIIDICYGYAYFEVFGLSDADFEELVMYYRSLEKKNEEA